FSITPPWVESVSRMRSFDSSTRRISSGRTGGGAPAAGAAGSGRSGVGAGGVGGVGVDSFGVSSGFGLGFGFGRKNACQTKSTIRLRTRARVKRFSIGGAAGRASLPRLQSACKEIVEHRIGDDLPHRRGDV